MDKQMKDSRQNIIIMIFSIIGKVFKMAFDAAWALIKIGIGIR